ncbi:MAG: hypothetical protein JWP35_2936 [Caulobacter sp.]|nr:hypothetical protein [Caulobacter sp.]
MQAWVGFYTVMAAAAATLLGLLFVAVSINAVAALGPGEDGSKGLAEQGFQNYCAVLIVSLLALYPDMRMTTFGTVTLSVTASWSLWVLVRLYQTAFRPMDRRARFLALRRHFGSVVGFAMMLTAALRMALGRGSDVNLLASATIVLLFAATMVSWELLTRLAKGKG